MVASQPPGETLREIAARYDRAETTVRNQWSTHPEWPAPTGKRGQAYLYDPDQVDAVVTAHFVRPAVELEPGRLYSAAEIAAATGISAGTIRAERSKGRWPAPDDQRGAAKVWLGATVAEAVKGRQAYRRRGAAG
ncbi:hypothetical protein L1085_016290 [Streptomyces sp. MSC1_001]|jgi:hypothetical protein|uniref:hypothetical protein n=1 Tax=Streptomyces sp. MSC1_001 TaxID=2909263 RepID=UPI00202F4440|nr:hypothetical protein [Streptomyces sp. MSC1_001]